MTWVVNLGTDLPEASGLRIHAGDRAVLKQDWAGGGGGMLYSSGLPAHAAHSFGTLLCSPRIAWWTGMSLTAEAWLSITA